VIGSISEQRDQLMALERRRQEVAAQRDAQQAPPAVAAPVAASVAAALPAAGYTPAAAFKAAEPDAVKRRKGNDGKRDRDLKGRDLEADPMTDAHEVAEGGGGEDSRKSFRDRGAQGGPSAGVMPGHPQPASFDRGYIESGHAAESPQAEPARTNPMPLMTHRVLPDQPYASAIPPHVISSYAMGSPSDR
jgi:hypothetical protein